MLYLSTGSNLGHRKNHLAEAEAQIAKKIGRITRKSRIYETSAWGITDQPSYLNQVLEVETSFTAFDILGKIHQIEQQAGRHRLQKWAARTLDIDILFLNNQIIDTPNLNLPHPHLQDRNFVLVPLCELIPDFQHPILQKKIHELRTNCSDELAVSIYQGY